MNCFTLDAVRKEYATPAGAVAALANATAAIGPGFTAIVGPSGGGKSTLLNLLGGIDAPTAGEIRFLDEPVPYGDEGAMRRYRSHSVATVYQELNLISHQTLADNVALPRLLRGIGRRAALAEARQCLALLGIGELAGRYPDEVSRGQKQRAAIARAINARTPVILADEPTGSLDPDTAHAVVRRFFKLSRKLRRSVVLVTHDVRLVRRYCDRMFVCTGGLLKAVSRRQPQEGVS